MNFIERALMQKLKKRFVANKVVLLFGARRTGKSHLLKKFTETLKEPYLHLNGEDITTNEILERRSIANYKRLLGKRKILIIDEAQKIPQIGSILKLMIDGIEGLKIIATGSSVFDLNNKLGEPLTGRSYSLYLYPLAHLEYIKHETLPETKARLAERIIYGNYPELVNIEGNAEKAAYLKELVNSYLLKDILEFEGVRNSVKMLGLLKLIAFAVGKEVSVDGLGRQLGISKNTVERYLDLLTKVFVIYRLQGFSRNLGKEITKSSKWYFFDNGIRNALIANFNELTMRNDTGELWENYILAERIKFQEYTGMVSNNYFWRTYQQQEIDWIEERNGKLYAYEMKWKNAENVKVPSAWKTGYPDSKFEVITSENYIDWIEN
ncbi:MAG: ATP-binding protein [Bacteroidia bacterium]